MNIYFCSNLLGQQRALLLEPHCIEVLVGAVAVPGVIEEKQDNKWVVRANNKK